MSKNIYPIGNQYHGRFKTAIDLKIQYSNISCPSCSENMLLGWFTGVTIPFRLGLGSSQHGTQLRIANGIRNGPSPLVKATKCQNTVTEKKPLQHGGESVANVIQKSKRNKSYPRMLTSCAATVTLQWGIWKEPAGSLLLCPTDGQFYWLPSQKSWVSIVSHPTQPARLSTEATSGCGLCWSGQLSSREQSEGDQSMWKKE